MAATGTAESAHLTTFVGREWERVEVHRLLGSTRLLTLVGIGGIGKTRLALAVSRGVADAYLDGTRLVELAGLADPNLVAQTVASALGLAESAGQAPADAVSAFVASRQLLLILDNCEHVLSASAALTEHLLRAGPRLQILATSREPLGVPGEMAWRVPSLPVPSLSDATGTDEIAAAESVQLFCERALRVNPEFVLHERNALAVARICQRVDGIPLAIELAAARVNVLSIEEIAARLDDGLRLLVKGNRFAPERQHTLRATFEWSYALLDESERVLFRRLSVFASGWSLEAAEMVCSDDILAKDEVLETLSRLVDKSLVIAQTHRPEMRFRMLETVRQYGAEKLRDDGETDFVLQRAAVWYRALAERAEVQLAGAKQATWVDRVELEHDNLRAVLAWARVTRPELAVRLATGLAPFWDMRGYLLEGRNNLEDLLPAVPTRTGARAALLRALGELAVRQGDNVAAHPLLEESVDIERELGDSRGEGVSMARLGLCVALQGDYARGGLLLDQSVTLLRAAGDPHAAGLALGRRGMLARTTSNLEHAQRCLAESLDLLRPSGDHSGVAFVLNNLGQLARIRGDYGQARKHLEESLALFRGVGAAMETGWTLGNMGNLARLEGDVDRSQRLLNEALAILDAIGGARHTSQVLCFSGILATHQGFTRRGVRLIGAASRHAHIRASLDADELRDWDACLAIARTRLGDVDFERAWAEGLGMGREEAVVYALSSANEDDTPPSIGSTSGPPDQTVGSLTVRERDVVRLIARGFTNREIASELVISERTAEAHVTHALNKVGLRSRGQLAIWALQHNLVNANAR